MAKPTTIPFGKMLILVGNGASPEVFAAPCGITSKGLDISASSNEVQVPDCDDPDAPAWVERAVQTLSWKFTGSGILAVGADAFDVWNDWSLDGLPRNVRIKHDVPDMGYYSGAAILSTFGQKAALGEKVQIDISLDGDGQLIWTDV